MKYNSKILVITDNYYANASTFLIIHLLQMFNMEGANLSLELDNKIKDYLISSTGHRFHFPNIISITTNIRKLRRN